MLGEQLISSVAAFAVTRTFLILLSVKGITIRIVNKLNNERSAILISVPASVIIIVICWRGVGSFGVWTGCIYYVVDVRGCG